MGARATAERGGHKGTPNKKIFSVGHPNPAE